MKNLNAFNSLLIFSKYLSVFIYQCLILPQKTQDETLSFCNVEYNAALTGLYLYGLFNHYHNIVLTGLNTSSVFFIPIFLSG